ILICLGASYYFNRLFYLVEPIVVRSEIGELYMRKQKGFSLIELLIVVAIILIIAAIAIPSLVRSKATANESAGAATIRTLITAAVSYSNSFPARGYPTTITNLGSPAQPCQPDPILASC